MCGNVIHASFILYYTQRCGLSRTNHNVVALQAALERQAYISKYPVVLLKSSFPILVRAAA